MPNKTDLEKITGTPDHDHAVARCFGELGRAFGHHNTYAGHGVTWKHTSGANLRNLRCPVDGGSLYQTTRGWRNDSWVVIPADVVKKAAGAKRAEKKDALQVATARLVKHTDTGPSCLACDVSLVPTEHGWTDTATGLQEGEDGHLHYVHEQIAADEDALAAARTSDEDHNYHVSPEAKDSCETCNPYTVVDDATPVGNVLPGPER